MKTAIGYLQICQARKVSRQQGARRRHSLGHEHANSGEHAEEKATESAEHADGATGTRPEQGATDAETGKDSP